MRAVITVIGKDNVGILHKVRSPSMRREWIEMLRHAVPVPASRVSLYAEGVD